MTSLMEYLGQLYEFLNLGSVTAFLGALFAFLAVIFTDWRRRGQKKKQLKALIFANQSLARKKLETVRGNLDLIREHNRATGAPIMPFYTPPIRELQIAVLDRLNNDEIQALDVLVFWMSAIDELLLECTTNAVELKRMGAGTTPTDKVPLAEIDSVANDYISSLDAADRNLGLFVELSTFFLNDECHKILGFEHSQ